MKLNMVLVIGNLVKDATTVMMKNGKIKQSFSIAINDDYKKSGTDEWIKRPYFFDCYVVGKEYKDLVKGKKVLINGKLITKTYETDGVKKKYTAIEVFTLDLMHQKDSGYDEVYPAKEVSTDEIPF